jgi:hypothetical protein
MSEVQASTIYVSAETALLARELEELTGVKASRMFREFVQQYHRTMNSGFGAPANSLAFILPALARWDVTGPKPFLSGSEHVLPEVGDIWSHVFNSTYPKAFKVFLMGKSLEHPISNHKDMWIDFVESGGVLEVLFQGDISSGADPTMRLFATNDPSLNTSKLVARERTSKFLKQLSDKNSGQVIVRNSGQLLLTMNAGIIFRIDGTVDMHLEFGLGESVEFSASTIIMSARHDPPDDKYRLVAGSMEGLWLRSLPEVGFDSRQ